MSGSWSGGGGVVVLPHGLFDSEGGCHRQAVLRPVTGTQEALLASTSGALSPAATSLLLASCVEAIGDYEAVDADLAAALTRGDRQALLLAVRAGWFGGRLPLVVRCGNPACAERADVDLAIEQLLPVADSPPRALIEADVGGRPLILREPTGLDDELLAETGGERAERSALLWSRLVQRFDAEEDPTAAWWRELPAEDRQAIALVLVDEARAPELDFVSPCPNCQALLEFRLDPASLLVREMVSGGERLVAEIHSLAFFYGWSEHDALALTRERRWRYLDLIGRQLDGRPLLEPWA